MTRSSIRSGSDTANGSVPARIRSIISGPALRASASATVESRLVPNRRAARTTAASEEELARVASARISSRAARGSFSDSSAPATRPRRLCRQAIVITRADAARRSAMGSSRADSSRDTARGSAVCATSRPIVPGETGSLRSRSRSLATEKTGARQPARIPTISPKGSLPRPARQGAGFEQQAPRNYFASSQAEAALLPNRSL